MSLTYSVTLFRHIQHTEVYTTYPSRRQKQCIISFMPVQRNTYFQAYLWV